MRHPKARSPRPAAAGRGLHISNQVDELIENVATRNVRTRPAPPPKPRRAHIFEPDPHSHYVEPFWCSERLFAAECFGAPGAILLDPACGWGRILQSAQAAGYSVIGSDIVERLDQQAVGRIPFRVVDFLKPTYHWNYRIESIVSNPPFDHIEKFSERALELATYKVAMLVPLRRLPAARWLERMPLETIHLLTPRPSVPPASYITAGNTPGGGSQDFCWLTFNKFMAPAAPRLRWLQRISPERAPPPRSLPGNLSGGQSGKATCQ